ncbi:hypothetical protein GYMLUDRAFT_38991 [Collybiopsis luxurians FD-317 M1]|nr:hypothetical protein GYMLUDRAFT_38991 [Collybiopsis luxurians FD-317 M1]
MFNNENRSQDRQDREQLGQPASHSSSPRLNYNYNANTRRPSLPLLRSNPSSVQHPPHLNSRPSSSQSAASIVSVSPPASATKLQVQIPNTNPASTGPAAAVPVLGAGSSADTPIVLRDAHSNVHTVGSSSNLSSMPTIPTQRPQSHSSHTHLQSHTNYRSNQQDPQNHQSQPSDPSGPRISNNHVPYHHPSPSTPGPPAQLLSGPAAAFMRPIHSTHTSNHSGSSVTGPPPMSAPAVTSTGKPSPSFPSSSWALSALPGVMPAPGHPSSTQQRRASGPIPSGTHNSPFASPLSANRSVSTSTSPVFLHRVPGSNTPGSGSVTAGPGGPSYSSNITPVVSNGIPGGDPSPSLTHATHTILSTRPQVSPTQKHKVLHDLHVIHPSQNLQNSMPAAPPPTPFTPSTQTHPQPPTPTSSAGHPAQQATSALLSSTQRALEHTWNTIISSVDVEISKLHSSHAGQIKVWAEYSEGLKRESAIHEREVHGLKAQLKSLESQIKEMRQEEGLRKSADGRSEQIQLELIADLQKELDGLKGRYDLMKGERDALQATVQREGDSGDANLSPTAINPRTSAEWDRLKADLERIRGERNELRRQATSSSSQAQPNQPSQQVLQLQHELDSLRSNNASLLAAHEKTLQDVRDLHNTQQTYAILQTSHQQLATSYNTLLTSNNNLQASHTQLKRDFEDLLEREEKARNKKNIAEETLKKERERAFEIDEARKREKKERKEREKEVAELKKKLDLLMGVRKETPKREIIDVEDQEMGAVLQNTQRPQTQAVHPQPKTQPKTDIVFDVDGTEEYLRSESTMNAPNPDDNSSRFSAGSQSVSASPTKEFQHRSFPESDCLVLSSGPGSPLRPSSIVPSRADSIVAAQSPPPLEVPLVATESSPRASSPRSPFTNYKPLSRSEMHHYQKSYVEQNPPPDLNQSPESPVLDFGPSLGKRSDSINATIFPVSHSTPQPRPASPFHPTPVRTSQSTSMNLESSRPSSSSAAVSSSSALVLLSPSLPHTLPRRPSSTSIPTRAGKAKSPPRLNTSVFGHQKPNGEMLSSTLSPSTLAHMEPPMHSISSSVQEGEGREEQSSNKVAEVQGEELETRVTSDPLEKGLGSLARISSPSPFTSMPYLDNREEHNDHHGQHQQRQWNSAHRDSPLLESEGDEIRRDQGQRGEGEDGQSQRNSNQDLDRQQDWRKHRDPSMAAITGPNRHVNQSTHLKRKADDEPNARPYSPQAKPYFYSRDSQSHKLTKVVRDDGQVVGVASPAIEVESRIGWRAENSGRNQGTPEQDGFRSMSRELTDSHFNHNSSNRGAGRGNSMDDVVSRPSHSLSSPSSTPAPNPNPPQSATSTHSMSISPVSPLAQNPTVLAQSQNPQSHNFPPSRQNSISYSSSHSHAAPNTNSYPANSKPVFASLNHQPSLPVNPIHSSSPAQAHLYDSRSAEGWKKTSAARGWEMNMNGSGSSMSVMNMNGGSANKGWKTASGQDQPPSTSNSSNGQAASTPPKQLSFKHVGLLYDTVGSEYVCRECRAMSTSTMTKPKSFPISAPSFTELFAHISEEHKEKEEEVLKYSPVKLQEQLVLLKSRGPHLGGGQGNGGKKVGGRKNNK